MSEFIRLISVTTSDGLSLHGAQHLPTSNTDTHPGLADVSVRVTPRFGFDAVLLLHGVGGNFYGGKLFDPMIDALVQSGVEVFSINTRGHDTVYSTAIGGKPTRLGAAYEIVADCVQDIQAWETWISNQSMKRGNGNSPRIILIGHSLGAVKALFAAAQQGKESQLAGVVSISAPCLTSERLGNSRLGSQYSVDIRKAAKLVEGGCEEQLFETGVPFPMLMSARSFLDKYGQANRYDVLPLAQSITVPTLFTYGELELDSSSGAFQGLPELLRELPQEARRDVNLIAGADHFYTGKREFLTTQVRTWLEGLAKE